MERRLGQIFISLLSFFLIFALAELAARIFFPESRALDIDEFQREVYAEPRPFVMHGGTRDPELARKFKLNASGYRGNFPSATKPDNELRIFIVGGSTVLVGEPSLPEMLESQFQSAEMPAVKVFNFGVMAANTRMDLTRVIYEILQLKPDLIIFYGGGNDVLLPFNVDPRPTYPYNFTAYERNPLLVVSTTHRRESLLPFLLFQSRLAQLIAEPFLLEKITGLGALRKAEGWATPQWSERLARHYLSDLELAEKILSSQGIETRFIFQPIACYKDPLDPTEASFSPEALCNHAERFHATLLREVSETLKEPGRFADLSDMFDQRRKPIFRDPIHLVQDAQPEVARRLFELTRPIMLSAQPANVHPPAPRVSD